MFKRTVRSKKKREARKKNLRRWFVGISTTLIIVFVGVVILLNQPFSRIGSFEIIGNETVHTENIVEEIEGIVRTKAWWIFPRDTIFFYPKKRVDEHVVHSFSRLRDVRLKIKDLKTLVVRVTEHEPEYLWCGPQIFEETEESLDRCYYMDQESYVFSEAPYFSDHVFLKFTGSHNSVPENPLRSYIYEPVAFEQLLELRTLLLDRGIEVNKIAVEEHGDYKLFVDMIGDKRVGAQSHIIVNFDDTNNIIIENLQVAFRTEQFVEKLESFPEALEYIDLRFPDKIVYRFKSGTPDTDSQE